jgi:hypothetical protein
MSKPCPHRPDIAAAGKTLNDILPEFLERIGLADKLELVVVLRSTVCDCTVCIAPHPEGARAAARELESVAQRDDRPKAQPS